MSHPETAMRVAGVWLTVASVLLAFALIGHGPIDPDAGRQMAHIADNSLGWVIVHWASAAALSLFALAGLIVIAAGSRLTGEWWTMSAWGALTLGALWTMTTAVAEATVVADAAVASDAAVYESWSAFAEGKANGFMFVALAVAVIAGNESRTAGAAPAVWASRIAAVAGVGSFLGWPLGMWFGVGFGNLLWVVSSVVVSLWTLWFGLDLARTRDEARLGVEQNKVTGT